MGLHTGADQSFISFSVMDLNKRTKRPNDLTMHNFSAIRNDSKTPPEGKRAASGA